MDTPPFSLTLIETPRVVCALSAAFSALSRSSSACSASSAIVALPRVRRGRVGGRALSSQASASHDAPDTALGRTLKAVTSRQEGSADFSMAYGLPGKPGYQYTRPFDYFLFEFTAVPNASTVSNGIENVTIRGLLLGTNYEWGGDYRGVWGLFGGYDYLSPQLFRV